MRPRFRGFCSVVAFTKLGLPLVEPRARNMGYDDGAAAPTVSRGTVRPRVFGEAGVNPEVVDGGDAALVHIRS